MKKGYVFVSIVLLAGLFLSACAPQAPAAPAEEPAAPAEAAAPTSAAAPADAAQPEATEAPAEAAPAEVTLEYWVFSDYAKDAAGELQKTFIAEFEASHPGVKINLTGKGDDELNTGLTAAATSNTLPALFMSSTGNGAQLVAVEALANVSDKWAAMPEDFRSQFNPDMVAEVSPVENTMYGMPYTGYATFMYRNLSVLKAAGIDPNEPISDWSVWLEQMKKIDASGNKALASFSYDWWDFLNIYSGAATKDEWGIDFANKATLVSPEKYAQTAQFLLDAKPYSTELGLGDQGTTDLFLSNKLAFLISGPWANPTLLEAKNSSGLEYDYVVIPGATPEQKGGVRGTEFIGFAPGETLDVAWEFAMYICDEPQMTRWAKALSRYNSNQTSLAALGDDSLLQITSEAANDALFERPPHFTQAYPGNYLQTITDNLAAIEGGQLSPEDGAQELINSLNEVINAE